LTGVTAFREPKLAKTKIMWEIKFQNNTTDLGNCLGYIITEIKLRKHQIINDASKEPWEQDSSRSISVIKGKGKDVPVL
jgi:hypothetical protein